MKFRSLLAVVALLLFAPLSQAAITIVAGGGGNFTCFPGTSCAITFSQAPVVGNYVIFLTQQRGNASGETLTASDNQGNTCTSAVFHSWSTLAASAEFICKINAESGSYTITANSGTASTNWFVSAIEVSGLSGAVDQNGSADSGGTLSTSQSVTAAATNTNANDLVVAVVGLTYNGGTPTGLSNPASSGYTDIAHVDSSSAYQSGSDSSYKIVTSTEQSSAAWTSTSGLNYTTVIATFPGSSGGGGGGASGSTAVFNQILIPEWVTVTTNTTLSYIEPAVLCNATTGARTITLTTAVNSFTTYHIKKLDSSANNCTIATTNSQTIDGVTTKSLSSQYQSATVFSDGANWWLQ